MPMSTEEAFKYLEGNDKASEPEQKVESTPSVDDTPASDSKSPENVAQVEDKAEPAEVKQPDNDGKPAEDTNGSDKGSDEPKEPNRGAEVKVDDKKDKLSQRDYAFIREKQKRKEQKAKYEARIKELEEELKKRDGLEAKHFTKEDGSADPEAYIRNEFAKRDMTDELNRIKQQDAAEQNQLALEQDRIITEHCFQGKELEDYRNLIDTKGKAFAAALKEHDTNDVVLNYLDTLQEYPIVLKELMTNMDTLRRLFRSKDPDTLKHNIEKISGEILDKAHSVAKPQEVPQPAPAEPKKALPVIGKQITNQTTTVEPTVKDRQYWNNYLRNHPHG